jgi:aubergine-like protein
MNEYNFGTNLGKNLANFFSRPGTVRVPAPCQYAHKLTDLVGAHVHRRPSEALSDKLYYL